MNPEIEFSKSLKHFNTFGVEVRAKKYLAIRDKSVLPELFPVLVKDGEPMLILGGGSNILFTGDYEGVVLHLCNKGISIEAEDDDFCYVRVEAGEVWDEFVQYCLAHGLGGIENLVAIPGSVGAAPVQNIGAYGMEVSDTIIAVEVVSLSDGSVRLMSADDCSFGYRTSIFKGALKGSVIITSVIFRLTKRPVINAGYGDVKRELDALGLAAPGIRDVANVIREIRNSKLPDHTLTGNAGSFFKNPVVQVEIHQSLQEEYPGIVAYPQHDGTMKLAAGWMIEQCGLKGLRMGRAAVHDRQALVLVNLGGATGAEILQLARHIIDEVDKKFSVRLEPEVNII